MKKLTVFLTILSALLANSWQVLAIESSQTVSILQGQGYKLADHHQTTLTFDNYGHWTLGDHLLFLDIANPVSNNTHMYAEWEPRISLRAVTGLPLANRLIEDVFVAGQFNFGITRAESNFDQITDRTIRRWLVGGAIDLNLPCFKYVRIAAFYRKDLKYGTTYQQTTRWNLPFHWGPASFAWLGHYHWVGRDGSRASQFIAQPQLLLDLANFWGYPNRLWSGIEYRYWHHKYSNRAVTERVWQWMFKLNLC